MLRLPKRPKEPKHSPEECGALTKVIYFHEPELHSEGSSNLHHSFVVLEHIGMEAKKYEVCHFLSHQIGFAETSIMSRR